jgi:hypothetical protein
LPPDRRFVIPERRDWAAHFFTRAAEMTITEYICALVRTERLDDDMRVGSPGFPGKQAVLM